MRSLVFLSLISFVLFVSTTRAEAAAAPRRSLLAGAWQPIKNTSDPHIQKIAAFAVSEHEVQEGERLTLVDVVAGEQQVVAGFNYRLIFEAKPPTGAGAKYKAAVSESLKGDLELTYFARVLCC